MHAFRLASNRRREARGPASLEAKQLVADVHIDKAGRPRRNREQIDRKFEVVCCVCCMRSLVLQEPKDLEL